MSRAWSLGQNAALQEESLCGVYHDGKGYGSLNPQSTEQVRSEVDAIAGHIWQPCSRWLSHSSPPRLPESPGLSSPLYRTSVSRSREFRDSDCPQVRSCLGAALVCIARLLGASAAAGSSRRVASAGIPAAADLARGCAPGSERAPPAGSCGRASHAASRQQPWHLPGRPHWGSASPPPRPARPCPPQPSLISP